MLTPTQYKALKIISTIKVEMPRQFAELMWPDASGWRRTSNVGRNGAAHGVGMCLAGGGYLGKLQKHGLVSFRHPHYSHRKEYYVTSMGKDALEEYEKTKALISLSK